MINVITNIMARKPILTDEEAASIAQLAEMMGSSQNDGGLLMVEPGMSTPVAMVLLAGLEALRGDDDA